MKHRAILLVCWWGWVCSLYAATWYVATNGSDSANGTGGWDQAYATISNAVFKANTNIGDWVLISNGTHLLSAQVAVTNGITVLGFSENRDETIVDGNAVTRCFSVNQAGARLERLTIRNGMAASGGGVYLGTKGGLLTNCVISGNSITGTAHYYGGGGVYMATGIVQNCVIRGNMRSNTTYYAGGGGIQLINGLVKDCDIVGNTNIGSSGGGAGVFVYGNGVLDHCTINSNCTPNDCGGAYFYAYNGVVLVTNCTFSGNSANLVGGAGTAAGGAISRLTITDCLFSNNVSSNYSGGLQVDIVGMELRNCRVVNNRVGTTSRGGGLFIREAVTAELCVIQGNTAGYGGGILITNAAPVVLRNCLINGNTANQVGGGIYESVGRPQFVNCTIVSNTRYGIYNSGGALTNGVVNCLVYSNLTAGLVSNYNAGDGLIFTNSCTWPMPATGSGNVTNEPQFVNPLVGNYRLAAGSPCINAGINESWMDTAIDLQDRPRLYYGRVDIGCYEYFLNVKVNGIPIDRIKRINGVDKNRIFRINQ